MNSENTIFVPEAYVDSLIRDQGKKIWLSGVSKSTEEEAIKEAKQWVAKGLYDKVRVVRLVSTQDVVFELESKWAKPLTIDEYVGAPKGTFKAFVEEQEKPKCRCGNV